MKSVPVAAFWIFLQTFGYFVVSKDYGSLTCDPTKSTLKLRHESNEAKGGLEPVEVNIPRQICKLSFPSESCSIHDPDVKLPSAEAIADAAKPKPLVLVVKMGVGSPFAGDRAQILTSIVADVCAHNAKANKSKSLLGVQLVFLIDRSEWTKGGHYNLASEALPPLLKPLVVGYSAGDITRVFPTKTLKPRKENPVNARARAMGKYYETYSWSWWWDHLGKKGSEALEAESGGQGGGVKRIWVVEDDTVFTGSWAGLLANVLETGLSKHEEEDQEGGGADLISFRDYCTPDKSWIWARYMHEGWSNLTYPGQGLETWMTAYGLSPRFLDAVVKAQKEGESGHIEWFPATFALRNGFGLVFVEHDLRGKKLGRSCSGGGEKRGGTFNYCCQGKNTVDSENWFEGWKRARSVAGTEEQLPPSLTSNTVNGGASNGCLPPTLLHPVKGDACGRFSANGFGRGCWKRNGEGSGKYSDVFTVNAADPKTAGFFQAYSPKELLRTL